MAYTETYVGEYSTTSYYGYDKLKCINGHFSLGDTKREFIGNGTKRIGFYLAADDSIRKFEFTGAKDSLGYIIKFYKLTNLKAEKGGFIKKVQSINENAYPANGEKDGLWYVKE